jgi:outer membrane lipoprotein-sorting protein
MKFRAWLVFAGILSSVSLFAQQEAKPAEKPAETKAAETLPSVEEIIKKYEEALGGKAATEKVTSRIMKGTLEVTNFGATGTFEIMNKAPNKYVSTAVVDSYGTVQTGFDGSSAWSSNPQTGATKMEGESAAQMRRQADYLAEFKLREHFPKMTLKEKLKVGEKETYVVEAVPAEGGPEKFYFEIQTGLMIRRDAETQGPEGKVPTEFFLEDYREVEGVKIPFRLRQNTPMYNIEIKFIESKQNVEIEDSRFEMPKA